MNLIKCRAFREETIEFEFLVKALIGPNGGGQTTILGACALLYDSFDICSNWRRYRIC